MEVVQDQDTLIEQSPNYSNRTFSESINWFCYGFISNLSVPIHTMKCFGLFKRLDSSTCVVIMDGNSRNTQFRYTISIDNALRFNLVSFKFQNFPVSTLLF